jgi:DNA (cytosine-5)-methyltransferase 1
MVKNITEGLAVGLPLHINEMSDIFQFENDSFKKSIKDLKAIGYEVRNHNTNPQLDVDCYLIPYEFPTLNERSLQRLTSL